MVKYILFSLLYLMANIALAVEQNSTIQSSLTESTKLIGVISDAAQSVALIQNAGSGKSIPLKVGDEIPWSKDDFVLEITPRLVVVGNGSRKLTLAPNGWSGANEPSSKASESKNDEYTSDSIEPRSSGKTLRADLLEMDEEDNIDAIEALIEELDLNN